MHLKHLQELTNLNEAAGGFFTEAKGYSDSSEFTAEFYGELFTQVTKMKKVMKDPKASKEAKSVAASALTQKKK